MDSEDKKLLKKYLKIGLGSAVVMSGIGSVMRRIASNRKRNESLDPYKSKNSIVVGIDKGKFLSGIPTPNEQAELSSARAVEKNAEDQSQSNVSPFDFFAKKSSVEKDDRNDKKSHEKDVSPRLEEHEKIESPAVNHDDENSSQPRNSLGQFTKKTDPLAVPESEKKADFNWIGSIQKAFLHPVDTLEGMWESAKSRPVYMTAGGISAVALSTMIIDRINKIRAEKAKERAEIARGKYIDLLNDKNNNEKDAYAKPGYGDTENPLSAGGTLLGASFIIPFALTAIVANKIMENRKKKDKGSSDSYPEDPVILYKTSEANEIEVSPETAVVSMMVKNAMFVKSAGWDPFEKFKDLEHVSADPLTMDDEGMRRSADEALTYFNKPENEENFLGMIKDMESGNYSSAQKRFLDVVPKDVFKKNKKFYMNRGFAPSFATYGKLHDSIVGRYNDPKYKMFAADKDNRISDYMTYGGTFKKDGLIHRILMWISKALGIGGNKFNEKLRSTLGSINPKVPTLKQVLAGK